MEEVLKNCIVCGDHKHEGVTIWDHFICCSCEQEMVQTDVQDKKYAFFIERMRQLWYKKDA